MMTPADKFRAHCEEHDPDGAQYRNVGGALDGRWAGSYVYAPASHNGYAKPRIGLAAYSWSLAVSKLLDAENLASWSEARKRGWVIIRFSLLNMTTLRM